MCNNGRCIFNVLECDGLDSCGDNTDESTAAPTFCDRMNTALDSSGIMVLTLTIITPTATTKQKRKIKKNLLVAFNNYLET